MSFGEVLAPVEAGAIAGRRSWNVKGRPNGQYIFFIKSKDLQGVLGFGYGEYQREPTVVSCLAIHTDSNHIQLGWSPSQTDMLANDWEIY